MRSLRGEQRKFLYFFSNFQIGDFGQIQVDWRVVVGYTPMMSGVMTRVVTPLPSESKNDFGDGRAFLLGGSMNKSLRTAPGVFLLLALCTVTASFDAHAAPCVVPDNGSGTVTLPPAGCGYLSPTDVHMIIDGLPAGTTVRLTGIHRDFVCHGAQGTPPAACDFTPSPACEQPGGTLGGMEECSDSTLQISLQGTGTLSGWTRAVNLPVSFETHVGPRTPGQPVQQFPTDMYRLQGQLPPGDPDFDLLRITGGTSNGMPSPGQTKLTRQGTNWAVDSFFDITYRIDFIGAAGGHLGGFSGSTTGTIRMVTGSGTPCNPADCNDNNACTIDSCDTSTGTCVHTAVSCDDGQICTTDTCDPATGQCSHGPANCDDGNPCTNDSCIQALLSPACTVPDNGSGTVTLPPAGCDYLSPSDVHQIINGLPAGTTIQLGAIHKDFICNGGSAGGGGVCSFQQLAGCSQPGGSLGGEDECSNSTLALTVHGTGTLAGWNRTVPIPVSFETHVAPRTPGAPTQSFDTEMFRLFGQLPPGDPDFDLLRVTAGNDFGLPSPGHTTLTRQGTNFKVDSFFDITYRIDFVGHAGGHIGGMSGSTTGTIRMQTGTGVGCVHTPVNCDDGNPCTLDSCDPASGQCVHTAVSCDDGNPCTLDSCDPASGQCVHSPVNCDDGNACTADSCAQGLVFNAACNVPDNGGGTVTLPPAGCDYLSPSQVHQIINGLPAGTTIQFAAIHKDFICHAQPGTPSICSFTPPPGLCDQPGGTLGGNEECSQSTLQLALTGTGALAGWSRTLSVPIEFETHTAPKAPGSPVQSFDTEMFRLQGQLPPGDPDFDLLRITAGNDFGLPSPGHTTLRQQAGGTWNVDSFFDITYRIDFVGHPGGHVGGMSGSTTGTIRMATGNGDPCVHVPINCDDGNPCTLDSCDPASGCVHTPVNCDDGQVCTNDSCDPASGQCVHTPVNCDDGNSCTDDSCIQALVSPACTVPDNGSGTVTLPPAGCPYLSPQDVHQIINGLPAGTTIQFAGIHQDFLCKQPNQICSFPPPPTCEQAGGTLGGSEECRGSTLQLSLNGTGTLAGWTRVLNLPVNFETHVGPRTPFAPTQSFNTEMFRLQGQLPPGDPDFDLLRITAGNDFGLPSPGHTTLTQQGANWKVDSFFDITYRIDFVGHAGGHIGGMSGSTTGTIRMQTGTGVGCVHTPHNCDDNNPCTDDGCDPASGCFHNNNTGQCDDGNNCTINDKCANGACKGTTITPPAETQNVLAPNKTTYTWTSQPLATRYDVVRGSTAAFPVGPGGGDESCFNDLGAATLNDPAIPAVGAGFWYLSRGENTCGNGPWGNATSGPRITTTCP